MKNSNNNAGSIAGGFIIGALIGSAVGILFAPHKGKKTRKIIGNAVVKNVEFITSKIGNFTTKVEEEVEDIEHEIIGTVENIAPGFETFLEGKMINNAISFQDKMNQRPSSHVDHKMMRR